MTHINQKAVQGLERLEQSLPQDEREARKAGLALGLAEALRPEGLDAEGHYSLAALQRLAALRRSSPGEQDLPDHLSACPICLDLYQVLLEGAPEVATPALARFIRLFEQSRPLIPLFRPALLFRAAALVVLCLGAALVYNALRDPRAPVASGVGITLDGGLPLAAGAAMPDGEPIRLDPGASLALDDGGTSVTADDATTLSFKRSWGGQPLFLLHEGDVSVKAAKQRDGQSIRFRTPLGEVRVVGTEFSVTLESEPVEVHEARPGGRARSYASHITAVVVAVREGSVAVHNRHDQATVPAGRTAVLREGQPLIEVRE